VGDEEIEARARAGIPITGEAKYRYILYSYSYSMYIRVPFKRQSGHDSYSSFLFPGFQRKS
jgi:hypothetical protein